MIAQITLDGTLVITAEHDQEPYALAQWYENAFKGKCKICINPTQTLQLGPQVVELKVDEKQLNDDAE